MNDNRENPTAPNQLRTHFLVTEKWFDFFSLLPGFTSIDVCDRRIPPSEKLQFTVQSTDGHSFLSVTVFRFHA